MDAAREGSSHGLIPGAGAFRFSFRPPQFPPLRWWEAGEYRWQERLTAHALSGKERERCRDDEDDGRYERGKRDEL